MNRKNELGDNVETFSGGAGLVIEEDLEALERFIAWEDSRRKTHGFEFYEPNRIQELAHRSLARRILFCGGNRCLGGETKIYDPVLGKEIPVGEISNNFNVLAWDGRGLVIAKAGQPFKKRKGNLYKVRLSNGGSFIASDSHLVLTSCGFRTISDVRPGTLFFQPQTISESFQSVHVLNDLNSYQIIQGSQYSYQFLYDSYGEQPRRGSDISQLVEVIDISYVRNDYKWDFTVPRYHNYFAEGAIHHNSGKSTFGAMELIWHVTRLYPDWYPVEKRFKTPIKAVISATEFPIVSRVIEPKLFQYLPKDYYSYKRTAQGYIQHIECKDGSRIDILTSEMKDDAYESADWDFAWLDESQQRRKYEAIIRGLVDRRGRAVITFTPLTEPWMKEELVDKADGKLISCFQVDIRDNKFTIKGESILSEEAIQEFEQSISEDYRATRIHGIFFHMRGLIYKEFGETHITNFSYKPHLPVLCVLDPHDRLPHHVIWAFMDENDDIFIDTEMVINCELDDLALKIRQHEKANNYWLRKRLIDPNFGRSPAAAGSNSSVIQELARHGTNFYEANDNKELGHMLVRDLLHYDLSKPVTAVNKPKLFFSRDRAVRTTRSMRNYQYQEWQGKTRGERDAKEVDKNKDAHGADCVRYLVISRPRYSRLSESEKKDELISSPY